jgi:hypothetical protein
MHFLGDFSQRVSKDVKAWRCHLLSLYILGFVLREVLLGCIQEIWFASRPLLYIVLPDILFYLLKRFWLNICYWAVILGVEIGLWGEFDNFSAVWTVFVLFVVLRLWSWLSWDTRWDAPIWNRLPKFPLQVQVRPSHPAFLWCKDICGAKITFKILSLLVDLHRNDFELEIVPNDSFHQESVKLFSPLIFVHASLDDLFSLL